MPLLPAAPCLPRKPALVGLWRGVPHFPASSRRKKKEEKSTTRTDLVADMELVSKSRWHIRVTPNSARPLSVCEGHKKHDICACDGGLVPQSQPPVNAVTGWSQTRSGHTYVKHCPLLFALSDTLKEPTDGNSSARCARGMEFRHD